MLLPNNPQNNIFYRHIYDLLIPYVNLSVTAEGISRTSDNESSFLGHQLCSVQQLHSIQPSECC